MQRPPDNSIISEVFDSIRGFTLTTQEAFLGLVSGLVESEYPDGIFAYHSAEEGTCLVQVSVNPHTKATLEGYWFRVSGSKIKISSMASQEINADVSWSGSYRDLRKAFSKVRSLT